MTDPEVKALINSTYGKSIRDPNDVKKERFVVTGAQLLDLFASLIAKASTDKKVSHNVKRLNDIMNNQKIGISNNSIEDDVNDLRNLFASWINDPKS